MQAGLKAARGAFLHVSSENLWFKIRNLRLQTLFSFYFTDHNANLCHSIIRGNKKDLELEEIWGHYWKKNQRLSSLYINASILPLATSIIGEAGRVYLLTIQAHEMPVTTGPNVGYGRDNSIWISLLFFQDMLSAELWTITNTST